LNKALLVSVGLIRLIQGIVLIQYRLSPGLIELFFRYLRLYSTRSTGTLAFGKQKNGGIVCSCKSLCASRSSSLVFIFRPTAEDGTVHK
jgi:hypothetical protein